ncbi:MAG: glutamate 5-kinase [Candidatus Omnitrophota bacterium]
MSKKRIKRITVKVGSRVLTDESNRINRMVIKALTDQIVTLRERGIEVIVVSSGAIASGLGLLNIKKTGRSLSELQAIASIGQNYLMDLYNNQLRKKGYIAGQLLLTQEDLNDRKRFLNIRYTLNTLFKYNAIPIVNENDSVSTEEIKCGDNDRLSSLVADISDSNMLIILTDVEGVYGEEGAIIKYVETVTDDIRSLCKGKGCEESSGGMISKLDAANNAALAGIESVIARGKTKNIILKIIDGQEVGTRFSSCKKPLQARKRWIAFSLKPKGKIIVDRGAIKALVEKHKSLLPGGILEVCGKFSEGALIEIASAGKKVIARGLSNYSSEEIEKIKGKRTDQIEIELGYKDYDEVVHRDNLVVINSE